MPLQISLVHQFEQQQQETWDVHFSWDGKQLVSSDGKALYLWQLCENEHWVYERSLPFHDARRLSFAFDGKWLVFSDREGLFRLISLENEMEEVILLFHSRTNCAFSPDQRWLVAGDMNRNILLWDWFTHQSSVISLSFAGFNEKPETNQANRLNEVLSHVLFTPDSQRLAIGAANAEGYGCVYICHIDPIHKQLFLQETLPHGCIDLAISPDGKILATIDVRIKHGSMQQEIYLYDLVSFQLLHIFPQKEEDYYCLLDFSPDSQWLISCRESGVVDLFSLNPFACIESFEAHTNLVTNATDPIGGFDWAKTGYIATGGASEFEQDRNKKDYTIKIWKVEDK